MKLRIISTFLVVTTVFAWAAACGNTEPRPVCLVGHGEYAAKYTLKPGQTVAGKCAQKKGEVLGVQKYNAPSTPNDQTIAIKTATLDASSNGPHDGQSDLNIISLGKLTGGDPDADNFCVAPSLSTVHDVDGGSDIAYAWTNVKFYVTPRIPGTQFTAELAYTEAGCTANYNVVAVFPAVSCDAGKGQADISLCPEGGNSGSLNPDFPIACDPGTLLCVLDSDHIPAIK